MESTASSRGNQEELREAVAVGDMVKLKKLVEEKHVEINSQNSVNGWTALHWAVVRNHPSIVAYLLNNGADKTIKNHDGDVASQLTTDTAIHKILGVSDAANLKVKETKLPITANYLAYPPFPYMNSQQSTAHSAPPPPPPPPPIAPNPYLFTSSDNEMVLKARVANVEEKDYVEIELDRSSLTFDALLNLMCHELCIDKRLVHKIRKLPDTIIRKDKDVKRLVDFQEMELVLTSKALSASSRNYGVGAGLKSEQILY